MPRSQLPKQRELKIFICYSYGYSTKTNDVIYMALNKHGLHSIKNTCEQYIL